MLQAGIIGLPNIGKSILFNALTSSGTAEAANYPFSTIEPNRGTVIIQDERLEVLGKLANVKKIVPSTIEFCDIAGLVKGSSRGEGLGNRFLANIREFDAIIHIVRCFVDENIVHVSEELNPVSDIEIINFELALADIESVEKRKTRILKNIKSKEKAAIIEDQVLNKLIEILNLTDVSPEDIDENAQLVGGELGIDSIDVLEMVVMVEKDYGVVINNKEIGEKVFQP